MIREVDRQRRKQKNTWVGHFHYTEQNMFKWIYLKRNKKSENDEKEMVDMGKAKGDLKYREENRVNGAEKKFKDVNEVKESWVC